jgi:hypothetical protein
MPWLRMLHFSDSSLTMQVPLDGRRPYLHFDEAFKQQKVSTEIRNLELQFNPRDANENFLDGLLNKAIKDAQ